MVRSMKDAQKFLVVAGPTASGKSDLAMDLARKLDGEIVCCDSVQLYRGFDIGSAKPTQTEREEIKHHMVDVVSWQDDYDACRYARDASPLLEQISNRGKIPIVVGGTGLYLRALWGETWDDLPSDKKLREQLALHTPGELHQRLAELNPQRAAQIHRNDRYRLQRGLEIALLTKEGVQESTLKPAASNSRSDYFLILLSPQRDILLQRIAMRTLKMLEGGLVDEVTKLLTEGCPPDAKPMQSIGYKQVTQTLHGCTAFTELAELIMVATRQYAKRQRTWFNKVPAEMERADAKFSTVDLELVRRALGR